MDNIKVWGRMVNGVRCMRVEKPLPNGETICENHYGHLLYGTWWRVDSRGNAITRMHDLWISQDEFESLWRVATIEG